MLMLSINIYIILFLFFFFYLIFRCRSFSLSTSVIYGLQQLYHSSLLEILLRYKNYLLFIIFMLPSLKWMTLE